MAQRHHRAVVAARIHDQAGGEALLVYHEGVVTRQETARKAPETARSRSRESPSLSVHGPLAAYDLRAECGGQDLMAQADA